MSLLRAIPRFFLFLAVIAAVAAVFLLASQWTRSQSSAFEDEGAGSGLVRNTGAPWRNLNPDNLETQALEFYLNLNRQTIDNPVDPSASPVPFHVELGETGYSISERLQELGLIRDASLFRLYLRLNGLEHKLEAGDFTLSAAMTVPEMADALQSAFSEDVVVRIPEGRRAEEIALLLEEQGVVSAADFMAAVRTGDTALLGLPDYPLLADKPPGVSFEGYLFPDTYRLPVGARASDVLRVMFETLEFRVGDATRAQIAASGLTFHQALTLASIIERETALADERPLIASTYRNRLGEICANEVAGYLGADPTAQYAMGYSADQAEFEKQLATRVEAGDRVIVFGDGRLGQLIARVFQAEGYHPLLIGRHAKKLALAAQAGVETALEPPAGQEYDIAIDVTGNAQALQQIFGLLRPRGALILKTTSAYKSELDLSPVVVNELRVIGSRCGPFPRAIRALSQGDIDPRPLITAQFPLEQAETAFALARQRESLKVLLYNSQNASA
jgi:UPF0755 protein